MNGIDDAARGRIVGQPNERLVVVAGAGSGKTKNLVARVAALIRADVDPGRIAVITFTEKAARELLHRLRIDEQVTGIDRAYVGTIHGYCRRILRQFPIEAGLPPMFSVNDEITSSARAAQSQSDLVHALLDQAGHNDDLREALSIMAEFGKLRELPGLVAAIDAAWDQFESAALEIATDAVFRRQLADTFSQVIEILNSPICAGVASAAGTDLLAGVFRDQVAPLMAKLPHMSLHEVAHLSQKTVSMAGGGSNRMWLDATGRTPKEIRDLTKASFDQAGRLGCDFILRRVLHTLSPLVVTAAHDRLADGHVTFDDLLVLTRRLVHEHPTVLHELQQDLSHVFVDEFQDTDPVQFEIINAICDPTFSNAPVLFAVGDPKQAIYAFRAADVELFNRLADDAENTDSLVKLRANYRTRRDVTGWINATISARFAAAGAEFQSPYDDLVATRDPQHDDLGPATMLLGLDEDFQQVRPPTATVAAMQESADIVGVIRDAVGNWSVGPEDSHSEDPTLRPARRSDIAILVRTRAGLPILEHALNQAGIAYRIEGGSLVYESREVYEILRVLRAVDDPSNAAKVVAALRTTVLGVSDLDLFHFRHSQPGGRLRGWALPWNQTFDDGGHAGARRVFNALHDLRTLNEGKHTNSPAQMLAALYDSRLGAVVARFEGDTAQAGTWRRVRFVIDEARQWSDSTGGTLREYLEWVDARIASTDRSEIATDEGEDSVRILTVHAAKGLQFPIVILAGLGRGDNNDTSLVKAKVGPAGRPEVRMGKLKTLHVVADDEKFRDQAEEARLLYVAMTRAQDHLVVSMYQAARNSGSVASRVVPFLSRDGAVVRAAEEIGDTRPALADLSWLADDQGSNDPLPSPPRPDPAERTIWTPSALAQRLSAHGGSAAVDQTATGFGSDLNSEDTKSADIDFLDEGELLRPLPAPLARADIDPGKQKDPPNSLQQERSSGRYGTTVGIAVHHVLQLVNLDRPDHDLEPFVAAACDAADVPTQFRSDVDRLARSIISADLFQQLCRSHSRQREMYVGTTLDTPAGPITLWGYVDAVFIDEQGQLVIIDFKTDTAMASDDELLDRYRHQLAGYAVALHQATGLTVRDANLLIGTRTGQPARAVVAPMALLGAAIEEIRIGLA